tara:strand:+ start:246 stop:1175 length:930 start_codon:yes stop_codon:yes gene_type:complete
MYKISGVFSAALTPIKHDLTINKDLYLRHCQYLMQQGHDGLAIFGTTGEANSLSIKEKKDNLEFLLSNRINPKVLISGTGSSSLNDAIVMTKHAANYKVRAILLLPPFYYKNVSDEGLINYYRHVIEKVGDNEMQYVLYHIPQHTYAPISFKMIEVLLKLYPNNVVGLKDSSGDGDRMMKIIKYFNNFSVFCGHDSLALNIVRRGGAGAITAGTNICGKLLSFILKNYKRENEIKNFQELQKLLLQIRQVITSHEPISLMKSYFSIVDNIPEWNNVLPPLKKINEPENQKLVLILKELVKKIDPLIANT